jgi:hypothetical protein
MKSLEKYHITKKNFKVKKLLELKSIFDLFDVDLMIFPASQVLDP